MGLLVKNLRGTVASRYKIGRLSHRFAAHTGASVHTCQAAGCREPAGATAHVIPANGAAGGRTWLLCRVCKGHNSPRGNQPATQRARNPAASGTPACGVALPQMPKRGRRGAALLRYERPCPLKLAPS